MISGLLAAFKVLFATSYLCIRSLHNCIAAMQKRPAGDSAYCNRTRGRSPKDTRWDFDDDTV